MARENSARGHFEATWLEKTRLGVTSRPLGARKFGSGSLRGHLAREDSARGHFEATWLEEARLGVTSRTLGSGRLGSGLLRGHLARESSARVLSRPLDSLGLPWLCLAAFGFAQFCSAGSAQSGSACLDPRGLTQLGLGRTARRSYSKKLFENTVPAPLSSACLDSGSPETRMDILGFTLVYIYIYMYIYPFSGTKSSRPKLLDFVAFFHMGRYSLRCWHP